MSIKELRNQTGLSQSAFAELFGIPLRTIQDWEQNRRQPPEYVLRLIEHIVTLHLNDKDGLALNVSYACSDLIEEIQQDIFEFGSETECWLFWQTKQVKIPFSDEIVSVDIAVNYDFVEDEIPLSDKETSGYRIEKTTFRNALDIFQKQNRTF